MVLVSGVDCNQPVGYSIVNPLVVQVVSHSTKPASAVAVGDGVGEGEGVIVGEGLGLGVGLGLGLGLGAVVAVTAGVGGVRTVALFFFTKERIPKEPTAVMGEGQQNMGINRTAPVRFFGGGVGAGGLPYTFP